MHTYLAFPISKLSRQKNKTDKPRVDLNRQKDTQSRALTKLLEPLIILQHHAPLLDRLRTVRTILLPGQAVQWWEGEGEKSMTTQKSHSGGHKTRHRWLRGPTRMLKRGVGGNLNGRIWHVSQETRGENFTTLTERLYCLLALLACGALSQEYPPRSVSSLT